MFAKLVAVVVALGACGCTLLSLRQSRIQAASEIAQTQLRINQEDERLWVLRAKIAEQVTPAQVEQMADSVVSLRPLIPPVLAPEGERTAKGKTPGNGDPHIVKASMPGQPKPEAGKADAAKPDPKPPKPRTRPEGYSPTRIAKAGGPR